jgi:hypothetical protein
VERAARLQRASGRGLRSPLKRAGDARAGWVSERVVRGGLPRRAGWLAVADSRSQPSRRAPVADGDQRLGPSFSFSFFATDGGTNSETSAPKRTSSRMREALT